MSFEERALKAGLTIDKPGCFTYSDKLSCVRYKQLQTVDEEKVPYLAIFTKGPNDSEDLYDYRSYVSDAYQFIGNEIVNGRIRDSIGEVGTPIFKEYTLLPYPYTEMYNEIVIQNSSNVPSVGDVYPQLVVRNSYNGMRAASVIFGINVRGVANFGFGFRQFGTIRQVHLDKSKSVLSAAVGDYINVFSQSIVSLIEDNFNNELTEDDIMKTLELVEKIGKKRRLEISASLEEATGDKRVTSWDLFHVICRYSSIQNNLNVRVLLENVAESVLVVPMKMMTVLSVINSRKKTE